MTKCKVIQPSEMKLEPHPQLPKIKVAHLLTNRDDDISITCALVHLPVGAEVEKHFHESSDDIIYVVRGKPKMWIEGAGDVPMIEGGFLRIPKGVWHQPHDIVEDVIAYDVWYPFLV